MTDHEANICAVALHKSLHPRVVAEIARLHAKEASAAPERSEGLSHPLPECTKLIRDVKAGVYDPMPSGGHYKELAAMQQDAEASE